MKNQKLENFLGLTGVSSKIEWTLVESFPPIPPASCATVVWFRTLGRPAPRACEVFLCSSSPSPFAAAAAVAPELKSMYSMYFLLLWHPLPMDLLRCNWLGWGIGEPPDNPQLSQVPCSSCYLNQLCHATAAGEGCSTNVQEEHQASLSVLQRV